VISVASSKPEKQTSAAKLTRATNRRGYPLVRGRSLQRVSSRCFFLAFALGAFRGNAVRSFGGLKIRSGILAAAEEEELER